MILKLVEKFPKPNQTHLMICIGGLPGSGKTEWGKRIFKKKDFFIIDPDEYRKVFFLDNDACVNATEYIQLTQAVMCVIGFSILEIAIQKKVNIVVMDVFTDVNIWKSFFKGNNLKEYKKYFVLLAQPLGLCEFLMELRYKKDFKINKKTARIPDNNFLTSEAKELGKSIMSYKSDSVFEKIYLLTRRDIDVPYEKEATEFTLNKWKEITFNN